MHAGALCVRAHAQPDGDWNYTKRYAGTAAELLDTAQGMASGELDAAAWGYQDAEQELRELGVRRLSMCGLVHKQVYCGGTGTVAHMDMELAADCTQSPSMNEVREPAENMLAGLCELAEGNDHLFSPCADDEGVVGALMHASILLDTGQVSLSYDYYHSDCPEEVPMTLVLLPAPAPRPRARPGPSPAP